MRTAEIPEPLLIGNEYVIKALGSVTGIKQSDNHDGSFTYTHSFELEKVNATDNQGKVIKSKDNRKQSVKLRGQIMALDLDYDDTMTKLRHFLPEILTWIKKLE